MIAESRITNLPNMNIDMTLPANARCVRALKTAYSVLKWPSIEYVLDILEGRQEPPAGLAVLYHEHSRFNICGAADELGAIKWYLRANNAYYVCQDSISIPQSPGMGEFHWSVDYTGKEEHIVYPGLATETENRAVKDALDAAFNPSSFDKIQPMYVHSAIEGIDSFYVHMNEGKDNIKLLNAVRAAYRVLGWPELKKALDILTGDPWAKRMGLCIALFLPAGSHTHHTVYTTGKLTWRVDTSDKHLMFISPDRAFITTCQSRNAFQVTIGHHTGDAHMSIALDETIKEAVTIKEIQQEFDALMGRSKSDESVRSKE